MDDLNDRMTALFDELGSRLRERLDPAGAERAERFVRLYYDGTAPEDLFETDPLNLYSSALDHLRLAERRQPGGSQVRVYNPDLELDGWQSTHTVVTIVTDDSPFLVDSVSIALNERSLGLHLLIHPILAVVRDDEGRLEHVNPAESEGLAESFMRFEVDRLTSDKAIQELQDKLVSVLEDVRLSVRDWPAMKAAFAEVLKEVEPARQSAAEAEVDEIIALLDWLRNNHFTMLGYARYSLSRDADGVHLGRDPDSELGIMHRVGGSGARSRTFESLPADLREQAVMPSCPLILTKSNTRSTVHRAGYLDYIGIKRYDTSGAVIGEHRFLGLFTSSAYNQSPHAIPLLRRKIAGVVERLKLRMHSHDGKALMNILETFPRDELFQADVATLTRISQGVLHLQDRQRLRLFVRHDPFGRFIVCFVYVPRDRYSTVIRERFQDLFREQIGECDIQFETRLGEDMLARVLFTIRMPADHGPIDFDVTTLEMKLVDATRSWADGLRDALIDAVGEGEGNRLFQLYGEGISAGYSEAIPARLAVPDLQHLAKLDSGEQELGMSLYRPIEPGSVGLRFKLIRADEKMPLSAALPILENMGLNVVDEQPYLIKGSHGRQFWLHDFGMQLMTGESVDPVALRSRFQRAFQEIWEGKVENDGFNRLVVLGGMDIRHVTVLRAYCKYLLQIKIPFSQAYIEDTLAKHPELAQLLIDMFVVLFDPAFEGDRFEESRDISSMINAGLEDVAVRDEDIILRAYREVMLATLRTNAFQPGVSGELKPYISLKIDPRRIRLMPEPKPLFEIFVYAVRFEGVHLRGGKVARGGLRWSDRREDFRTEILGLMKAQQVKNSIIVPVGAKGGFVLKHPPPARDRQAFQAEGIACYRTFLSGLLDITDNRVGDDVEPPKHVVRRDEDDPYLVVAADKGTATFSDIANEVAESYGFWLADAFASGGSAGYDHKKMGITARGAWESVKRLFHELGRNCQSEAFSCVGIGDMSGDVFGNGMLLSRQTRLVAAFNHMHIFLDPDPDPEATFIERQRLFDLPRSTWADYNASLISKGGGIFARTAKTIQLTPEVRELLATDAEELAPTDLIKVILQAPVDLLWNGGIGTYVKASSERHAEAEDRANDGLRVDATQLRCKIVGEGGNLGLTQKARIEFANKGGRINTDFIDNSAGVDCSDHEVNIKILLGQVVAAGDMTRKQRDVLLAEMTDEVAELVLRDNILQNFCLSVAESMPIDYLDAQAALMHRLEHDGRLDRDLALLPSEEDIHERRALGRGLTRPELSVLLAETKNALYEDLVPSPLMDDPYLHRELIRYFPTALQERFDGPLRAHRLGREIIATWLTNSLVNRGLDVFVHELEETTGRDPATIAKAYIIVRDSFALPPLWEAVQGVESVPADQQIEALRFIRDVIHFGTAWFIAHLPAGADIEQTVERFAAGVEEVVDALPEILPPSGRDLFQEHVDRGLSAGIEPAVAHRLASMPYFMAACDIVEVAAEANTSIREAAAIYFAMDNALAVDRLRNWLRLLPIGSRWDRLACAGLSDDIYRELRRLSAEVLAETETNANGLDPVEHATDRVAEWLARYPTLMMRKDRLFAEIGGSSSVELPMVAVGIRALGELG